MVRTKATTKSAGAVLAPDARQLQLVTEIGQLWPKARERAKEIGEKLFLLREACRQGQGKEGEESFNQHLKNLNVPHSSAYHFIDIYNECVLVDIEFPANVVKVAATAGLDITDLGKRKVLLDSYRGMGSPNHPSDADAIRIVGVAVNVIAVSGTPKTRRRKLEGVEKCLAAQDGAFVTMYNTYTKGTKAGTPQRSAREANYVRFASHFFPATWFPELTPAELRAMLLSVGQKQTTLWKEAIVLLRASKPDITTLDFETLNFIEERVV